MKKILLILLIFTFYMNQCDSSELNIYSWSNYIPDTVIKKFTQKTGIKVNYDNYDSNEILEAKILAGKSGYDLVFPSERPTLDHFIKINAVRKLDYSKLPNAQFLSKKLMAFVAEIDPKNAHAVIYHWGTIGIGIDVKRVRALFPDQDISDLSLLFKPENAKKLSQCKITILDSQAHFLPMAFHYLGLEANSAHKNDIHKTYTLLKAIRPYISAFSSASYLEQLINREVCYSIGYSGDIIHTIHNAKQAGIKTDVQYFLPKQGAQMGFDMMAIPVDAPHPENALTFINFILDPKIMAEATNYVRYANAIPKSNVFLEDDLKNNVNIYPTLAVLKKMYVADPITLKQARLRNHLWTRFISNR